MKQSFTQKIFLRSLMICILLGMVVFGLCLQKIEHLPLGGDALRFEASRAHAYMTRLSKGFPYRVPWHENHRRAGAWIKSELATMGYQPQSMRFSEVIDGKQYTDLENIYVEKRGTRYPDEIVMVAAHYDITDTTVEGAMDDGSGVGVVMELARVFSSESPERTMIFLLTDSEEFGALWGAHSFARDFPRADKIVAVANFDFVTPEKQTRILTLCDGLQEGYTPLWLRELALDSLRSVTEGKTEVLDLKGGLEFIERAIEIPAADHGAFLKAGIPAFNWVGQTDEFPHIMSHYHHTPHDVAEAIEVSSFEPFGKGAERLLRSIDRLSRIPADFRDSFYWKISDNYYLRGWAVTLLHLLAFIPFLAYSLAKFGSALRHQPRAKILEVLTNEAKGMAIVLGSLLLGYAVLRLLPQLRVITQYETFPATQKSLMLYSPNHGAILLVIAAVLGVYWLFRRVFAAPEDDDAGCAEIRQALHVSFLALIIWLAFAKNSFLAVLLLLPPAYFWMALRRTQRHQERRVINALLLLGGTVTLITMGIVMSTIFHIGVIYWYVFLSAAYGLFPVYTVVVFFMALTVMIRLFRVFILAR